MDSPSHRLASQISCSTGWHGGNELKWEVFTCHFYGLVSQRPCKACAVCSRCTKAVIPEHNPEDDCKTQLLTFSSKSGTISGMWLIHHRWGTPAELQQEWNSSIQAWILALQQIHVSDWFQMNSKHVRKSFYGCSCIIKLAGSAA